jgi:diacylglycerol O-acyltransferase / wax synthase
MPARERISGVDTAWLRMEHPNNLMMIVGVLMFRDKLRLVQLRRTLENRWLKFRRFQQKALQDPTGAWWETDEDFDIGNHLHKVRLPGKAGKKELEDLVSELSSKGLDFSRPLWDFTLVENYQGGSAIVSRIHHCYADGIALIGVMLSLTGKSPEESLVVHPAAREKHKKQDMDFWTSFTQPVAGVWKGAVKLTRVLLEQGLEVVRDPAIAREIAMKGIDLAEELRKIAMMSSDSATRFKGPLGIKKRVAWADPLPLGEVKVIGNVLGCSVNDVLLATAAGALRDYLADQGDDTHGVELRAVVPVNLRPVTKVSELGNQFGLVFVELPVGVEDPLERLWLVRERMEALKGSYQPIVAFVLLSAIGLGPKILQDQVGNLIGRNATAVMTNVPGPQQPLFFAGKEIIEFDFWVPQSGGVGMGVSILSYNGKVQFGLITDAGLVPDPENIIDRFGDEFEKLVLLTLMGPHGPEFEADLEQEFGAKSSVTNPAPGPKRIPKRFRKG